MKRLAITLLAGAALAVLFTAPSAAQRGGRGVDPATRTTVEGTIVDVQVERGAGRPTILVEDAEAQRTSVRLGPHWMLEESGFTASKGDAVRLVGFECAHSDADLVAGRVENLGTGAVVELRDERGMPLWKGKGRHGARRGAADRGPGMRHGKSDRGPGSPRGPGNGPGRGSNCPRFQ